MTLAEYEAMVRQAARPLVVEVWAPWCGPCRAMAPALAQAAAQHAGRVDVLKINADESLDVVRALGVLGVPTVLVYREGRELARRTGAQSAADLASLFAAAATPAVAGQPRLGPSRGERWLRLGAGLALLSVSALSGFQPLLFVAGVGVAFTAVYDRCPIWQAVWPRLQALWRRPAA